MADVSLTVTPIGRQVSRELAVPLSVLREWLKG